MKAIALILFCLVINLSDAFSQENKQQDTIPLNNKSTPQDTLAPFDRSSNKHIEVPDPNRPPSNATPTPPRKTKISKRKN